MKMEAFRLQIVGLLDVWESWMVFPGGTLEDCKKAFEEAKNWNGGVGAGRGMETDEAMQEEEDLEGEPMEEDLDGEMMEE